MADDARPTSRAIAAVLGVLVPVQLGSCGGTKRRPPDRTADAVRSDECKAHGAGSKALDGG